MKYKKTLIGILVLISAIIVACLIPWNNTEQTIDITPQEVSKVEIYDSITDKKLLLCESPNGSDIAYLVKSSNRNIKKFDEIFIENKKTGKIKILSLENIIFTSEMKLEWFNYNYVAFTGHINPSLAVYVAYNSNSGEQVCKYYGIGFIRDKSNIHTYYTLPPPHFSDSLGNDKIYEDDTIIYEAGNNVTILGGLAINDEGNKFVFFEKEINSENVNLVIGEKQQNQEIRAVKKIKWDKFIGEVEFINESTIDIESKTNHIKFDINKEKIIGNG